MEGTRAAVTARGVVEGDPAALDALSQLRGPSVLAYCERVCGPSRALPAAAAAFAGFRADAIAAPDPLAINPEALLISNTRRSAAEHAPDPGATRGRRRTAHCAEMPTLLALDAEGTIDEAGRDRLRRHLARCPACREAQAAQRAGELSYRRPSPSQLTAGARRTLLAALVAVPTAGHETARLNGSAPMDVAGHEPVAEVESEPLPEPVVEPVAEPVATPVVEPEAEPVATPVVEPEAEPVAMPVIEVEPEYEPEFLPEPPPASVYSLEPELGARGRHGLTARYLAPLAVLLVGLAVVLQVAGVFSGGKRTHSSARSLITQSAPAALATPSLLRIPMRRVGPDAPAIPPGTSLPSSTKNARKAKTPVAKRVKSARSGTPGPAATTAPTRTSTPTPTQPVAKAKPKSTTQNLGGSTGTQVAPPQTATAPAGGGFQPSN